MKTINREEYEVLKELDDKWKWIARDEDGEVWVYKSKPSKLEKEWDSGVLTNLNNITFLQFIQWENDDPYNIAELIKEYEFGKILLAMAEEETVLELECESEETEVKKDLNWFKEQLDDIEMNTPALWSHTSIWVLDRMNELLDQLDEPEVLSQEFINEKAVEVYVDTADAEVHVAFRMRDLQNLLVPKQEEVDQAYKDGYEKGKQYTFYKGYLEGLAEGERKTNEYFESITEEPSYEQVQKYLSEHGIEVVKKEPETVADVVTNFWKSLERLKEVMSMEVEELEE